MTDSSPKPPSGRHKKFADLWLSGVPASDAYLQAGFKAGNSASRARTGAGRLLGREDVQHYIQRRQQGEEEEEATTPANPEDLKTRLGVKRGRFIDAWLATFDAEKACEAGGYSQTGAEARTLAGQILGRADIQSYLKALKEQEIRTQQQQLKANELGRQLEPRHKVFADSYIKSFDRAKAYDEAGYQTSSRLNAQKRSARLLQRADVQRYLEARMQEMQEKVCVDRDRVWQELGAIATARIDQVMNHSGELRSWDRIPEWVRAAIASYERIPTKIEGEYTIKVKMHNKTSALSILSRFYGLDLSPDDLIARIREYGFDVTYRVDAPEGMPLTGDTGNDNAGELGDLDEP